MPPLAYGERVTVQTNGVRNDIPGYARITSWVALVTYAEHCSTQYGGC